MDIRYIRMDGRAQPPFRATVGAAGWDLTAVTIRWDQHAGCWILGTGLAFEIPEGYVGLLFPRSSVYKRHLTMAHCVGVIDSDYRGEVHAIFKADSSSEPYAIGERCCQLVIVKLPDVNWVEADSLSSTERSLNGFGSTGD